MQAISVNSKHPEASMKVLNLANSDSKFRNMLAYGLEGKNYQKTGDNTIKLLNDGWNTAAFSQATFFNMYVVDPAPANMWTDLKEFNKTAKPSPILGFVFDDSKVQTQLACDAANANNIREIMACVDLPEIVDLQIQTVNKPLETVCDTGLRTVYVSVTLANEGTSDISSAVLHVEIDSAGTPWASFSETTDAIPSEGTTTHIFSQGYIVPNFTGNYIVRVYVDSLPADENLTNDSLEILACAILDDVSIDAFGQVSWTMEQNIPNPARTNTRIPYAIPQEGAILFKVMSINGQVLYTKEIDAMAGSHSMEFDITTLSNGIYYYSMEYQGQRIVKKMTIQK